MNFLLLYGTPLVYLEASQIQDFEETEHATAWRGLVDVTVVNLIDGREKVLEGHVAEKLRSLTNLKTDARIW